MRVPELLQNPSRRYAADWLSTRNRSERARAGWLRLLGMPIGRDVRICRGVRFWQYRAQLGEGVFIGPGCYFEDHAPVFVEDRVWIAAGCSLITATHRIGGHDLRAGEWQAEPIRIGAGSWIGANVTILSGVTVGPGCVIAAGSVVTGDCEPDSLYAGVPAVCKHQL